MLLMAVVHFGGAKALDVPAAASRQKMSKGRVILIVIIWILPIKCNKYPQIFPPKLTCIVVAKRTPQNARGKHSTFHCRFRRSHLWRLRSERWTRQNNYYASILHRSPLTASLQHLITNSHRCHIMACHPCHMLLSCHRRSHHIFIPS